MWKSKIVKQTGACLLIALALFIARNADSPRLDRGSEAAVAYLSKNYTVSDVMVFAKNSVKVAAKAPAAVTNAVLSAQEESKYAEPVDKAKNGETVSVHAVAAGTVSAVGENEKIGKFVKITHGEEAESIYGNCRAIQVKELERVKKGQTIATFEKTADNEFYYELSSLK